MTASALAAKTSGLCPSPQDRLTRGVQISKGLDRLKIGLYVQFNFELLFDVLGDRKAEAQEERQSIPIRLGADENYDYNCHGSGRKGGYNFHISRGDVNIFISTRKDWMKTPNILVDIGSASCWSPGYKTVLEYVTKLLRTYGGKVIKNSVSEVHFCIDFIGLPIAKRSTWEITIIGLLGRTSSTIYKIGKNFSAFNPCRMQVIWAFQLEQEFVSAW